MPIVNPVTNPAEAWQLTYGGVALGSGTAYEVMNISGLGDLPDLRTSDAARPGTHGLYTGTDLLAGRTIVLELAIATSGEADLAAKVAALRAITAPQDTPLPLRYAIPGEPDKIVWVKPRRRSLPYDWEYVVGTPRATIQFEAPDPRLYAAAETSVTAVLDATLTKTVTATNTGEFETLPVVKMQGPLTNPKLTHVESGRFVELALEIGTGRIITLDFANGTILDGTTSYYTAKTLASRWYELAPGDNTLTFTATAGTGNVAVTFRSAWV